MWVHTIHKSVLFVAKYGSKRKEICHIKEQPPDNTALHKNRFSAETLQSRIEYNDTFKTLWVGGVANLKNYGKAVLQKLRKNKEYP